MYTFKKEERLCNKKLIDKLYHNGSSFLCYPFKVSWLILEGPAIFPAQVVFSVPKKRFKRAVDRNLIKRRMREAYRHNKQRCLYEMLVGTDKKIVFSLGYVARDIIPYDFAFNKMQKLLIQLNGEILKWKG